MDIPSLEEMDLAARMLLEGSGMQPKVGLVLGSGLGALAEEISSSTDFQSSQIPGWPASTVQGHAGKIILGQLEGQPVCVMQGRVHFYEGYSMPRIGFPIRVMQRMGVDRLIVTNAAGAVNPEFDPGDLMLITDHINLIGMAGLSPLWGPNLEELGPRFPDMSKAYDRQLLDLARQAAREAQLPLREGIYICLGGPAFETPADLRFMRMIGVDAVGMSTVPEITVAKHAGMRALGISGISNKANLDGLTETTHEEVLQAGAILVPKLIRLIKGVLARL